MKFKIVLGCLFTLVACSVFSQSSKPIVVQNQYYPKPGKEKEVFDCRVHGSEVRAKLGLPKGRVLVKSNETGTVVIWECEYQSLEERKKDVTSLEKSEEFRKVQEHMSTLVDKFERTISEAKLPE